MIPCKKTAEAVATAAAAGVATPAPTASEVAAFNRENLTKQPHNVLFYLSSGSYPLPLHSCNWSKLGP